MTKLANFDAETLSSSLEGTQQWALNFALWLTIYPELIALHHC